MVTQKKDYLLGLDAVVDTVSQQVQVLRQYLNQLSERLAGICSRADITCSGDTLRLENCGDEWVFGHIFCEPEGIKIGWAFSGDVAQLMPGEEVTYRVTTIEQCSATWLRAICDREVIEALLAKLEECLLNRNQELIAKLAELESITQPPSIVASATLEQLASELGYGTIVSDWRKAQIKTVAEPESAIRMACAMIESVCKHILEDKKEPFKAKADLPTLYKAIGKALNFDPDPATAEPIRNICRALITVIENVGAFRNVASDAHGKGPSRLTVTASHAAFAVNAAGATATFLLERWKSQKEAAERKEV